MTRATGMTEEMAYRIYDVLVEECGAPERDRDHFIHTQTATFAPEYRFQGDLGFGGKFWRTNGRWYVNCYPEDETGETDEMCRRANERLSGLRNLAVAATEQKRFPATETNDA